MVSSMVPHRRSRAALSVAVILGCALLCGCSPSVRPVAVAPPQPLPALALLQAEAKGYSEGMAAGKRIQAKRDLLAESVKEKQDAEKAANVAVDPPAIPTPRPSLTYDSVGPAIPMGPPPQGVTCVPTAVAGIAAAATRGCNTKAD